MTGDADVIVEIFAAFQAFGIPGPNNSGVVDRFCQGGLGCRRSAAPDADKNHGNRYGTVLHQDSFLRKEVKKTSAHKPSFILAGIANIRK